MSIRLLDLDDRVITDTGAMVAKHNLLLNLALDEKPFKDLPFEPHPDISRYHRMAGTTKTAKVWRENDELTGPSDDTFDWRIPDEYASLDVVELCEDTLIELDLTSEIYVERLAKELALVEERGMANFLRCLLWITQTFRENGVVWGLGRGSSCASLVLYLLGVNKVDPVRYDIPMEEFYK